MKIEITTTEISKFIKDYFDYSVKVKYIAVNTIEVDYFTSLKIYIKEVQDYYVLLAYEMNWATNILAKSGKLLFDKNIDKNILDWNTSKKEILLNLKGIDPIKDLLRIYKLKRFEIVDERIILELDN